MLSLEKFLFDRYSIEIMLKKFHGKLNSELMRKSCATSFPDNIIVGIMLKDILGKFSKKIIHVSFISRKVMLKNIFGEVD